MQPAIAGAYANPFLRYRGQALDCVESSGGKVGIGRPGPFHPTRFSAAETVSSQIQGTRHILEVLQVSLANQQQANV